MVSTNKKVKNIPEDIQNCLSIAERELLFELAKNVPPEHVIVEIANKTSDATEALVRDAEIDSKRVYNLPLHRALKRRWTETVGLLAVIGYQHCDEVKGAVICLQRYLSPDIVVVVYDRTQPGPARAIKELITDLGNFVLWQTVNNLTALVADRCQHYWVINSNEIGSCRHCGRNRNFKRLARETTSLGNKKTTMRSYSMT